MNTNVTGFRWFSEKKPLPPCALNQKSLSIGRIKHKSRSQLLKELFSIKGLILLAVADGRLLPAGRLWASAIGEVGRE